MKHAALSKLIVLLLLLTGFLGAFNSCSKNDAPPPQPVWQDYICHMHYHSQLANVYDSTYDVDSVLVSIRVDTLHDEILFRRDTTIVAFNDLEYQANGLIHSFYYNTTTHEGKLIDVWLASDSLYCILGDRYLSRSTDSVYAGHKL